MALEQESTFHCIFLRFGIFYQAAVIKSVFLRMDRKADESTGPGSGLDRLVVQNCSWYRHQPAGF